MITKNDIKRCTYNKPMRTADDVLNKIKAHRNKMLLLADEWRSITRYKSGNGFNKTKIERHANGGAVTVTVTLTKRRDMRAFDREKTFFFGFDKSDAEILDLIEENVVHQIELYESFAKRDEEMYDKVGVFLMSIQPALKEVFDKLEDFRMDNPDMPEMAINELIRNYLQING